MTGPSGADTSKTDPAKGVVDSVRSEYERYRAVAEGAIRQVLDEELCEAPGPGENSIATLVWHVSGNLESRFTDFLTSDGEKPWRHRETEFEEREVGRPELLAKWSRGWEILFRALDELDDGQLHDQVSIRGVGLTVHEALHRSLAHISYHVGQIAYRARSLRGASWEFLSIPPGGSDRYNRDPTMEKAPSHAARVRESEGGGEPDQRGS